MAQYDTPPLVDPTTGRIPTYKQVMVQDASTGTYKVKYEYTKITSTSTAGADLTANLATPITEMTGYGTGTGDDSGGGDSGEDSGTGDGTDGGTTTSAMNGGGGGNRDGNIEANRFDIGTASVADLSGVLNPSIGTRVAAGLFTALAPTGLSTILGVGSAYQKGEVVKELNARAKAGTLGTNPETGALATNKELTAMLGNLSKSYGLFNNVEFSPELQKQITAANMVDAFSLTDDSTSVASQWANPVSEDELSDMLNDTMDPGATNFPQIKPKRTTVDPGDEMSELDRAAERAIDPGPISNLPQRRPTASMRSSEAYNRMEAAVTDGDVSGAVNAAKTSAGFAGSSRDTAERNMRDAAIGAGTNNENANYGANKTSAERRETENNKDIASARDAASKTEGGPGREVDKNNAVDNAARSNEVSDKYGNAVTNTQTDSNGNKTTTAVGFGGNKVSEKQKADGAGGDKPGRIICTELYRQGLISREDYMLDLYYTSKHLTPQHTAGYWHFAVPAVKAMRRSKFWTAFWREIAYNRLQDIKWRLGYGKFTLKGRIYSAIFEPFCYISGYFKPNATYKELYKGEY